MLMKLGFRSIFWFFEKTRKQIILPEEFKIYVKKQKKLPEKNGISIDIIFWFFEKTRKQIMLPKEEENI